MSVYYVSMSAGRIKPWECRTTRALGLRRDGKTDGHWRFSNMVPLAPFVYESLKMKQLDYLLRG